jgi:hypothetical protein
MKRRVFQVVAADHIAVGGIGAFGYGLYRVAGLGVCLMVVGVIAAAVGIMLDRNAR